MAPTTISLARIVELKTPIAWQEAVEVVHALDDASTSQGALITLDSALISVDGTVAFAPGPEHGDWFSPLRLLGRLLDGISTPPELRALVESEVDALSGFPSEGDSDSPKTLTINWFTRPNGASLIGRLAARGIAVDATATRSAAPAPAVAPPSVAPPSIAPPSVASPSVEPPSVAPPSDAPPLVAATASTSWPTAGFAPPSLAFVAKPREPEVVPAATPIVPEAPVMETLPPVPAAASIRQLRGSVSQPPARVEDVSVLDWLRENWPSGRTGVILAASVATFLMAVTIWALWPTRPATPVIAARGPVLTRSTLASFALPAFRDSPFMSSASVPGVGAAVPPVTTPPSRERAVVMSVVPAPVSSLSGRDTSVALSSNGYRSESAPVHSAPALSSTAGTAAAKPAPSPVRPNSEGTAAPAAPAGRSGRAAVAVDRRIYSAADEGVEPPTMVRLQMPSEPRPGEVGDSWVEVVVDEKGQVAQVRLHSSNLSLNDRMIVSAAKAWQFQPALKDGNPVKYVLRLPVTR